MVLAHPEKEISMDTAADRTRNVTVVGHPRAGKSS